jgi:hypothetical protein
MLYLFLLLVIASALFPFFRLHQNSTTMLLLCKSAPTLAPTYRLKEAPAQAAVGAAAGVGGLLELACCSSAMTLAG